jgi:hypothetical protein
MEGDKDACVVCLESEPDNNSKMAYLSSCKVGCRGSDVVCAECYRSLSRCVYCRRTIDVVEFACESTEVTEPIHIIGVLSLTLLLFFLLVVLSAARTDSRPDEPYEITNALGAPIAV